MSTQPDINIDGFFENIITSYENRIQKIQTAFQSSENITESSLSLFDNVLQSLNELKKERDLLNSKLCETLAKNGSLRKKDYNAMMSGILCTLDEKERLAETQFLAFIEDQKETAQSIKNSLLGIKDITSPDASEKIVIVKEQLSQISKIQEIAPILPYLAQIQSEPQRIEEFKTQMQSENIPDEWKWIINKLYIVNRNNFSTYL